MRVFKNFDQGSMSWLAVRAGVVTASEVSALFTPKWKISESKGVETYLAQKLAEKWLGACDANSFMSKRMEDGHLREQEGRKSFQFAYDVEVCQVAFIASDDLTIGCSPDGLYERNGVKSGLELKCPSAETHVKYLLAGQVPDDYIAQVHFSMYITGYSQWTFVSHRPGFPLFIKTVERDQQIMEVIEEGVTNFLKRLDTAYKCLIHLNDGQPPDVNTFRQAVLRGEVAETSPEPQQPVQQQDPNSGITP